MSFSSDRGQDSVTALNRFTVDFHEPDLKQTPIFSLVFFTQRWKKTLFWSNFLLILQLLSYWEQFRFVISCTWFLEHVLSRCSNVVDKICTTPGQNHLYVQTHHHHVSNAHAPLDNSIHSSLHFNTDLWMSIFLYCHTHTHTVVFCSSG